jgi:radical SAM protein with 4Fe4S-binding SPASM domain
LKVVDGIAEIGARHLSITGGEPTLREDLPKLIVEAQEKGLHVSVFTNTLKLTDELMNFLAKREVEVHVSIDGASKEIFAKIRGPYFDLVLERTRRLRALGVEVEPVMTVNAVNYSEAGRYVELCAELGASSAALIPIIPVGRANRSIMPTPSMTKEAFSLAAWKAEEVGLDVELWCSPFASSLIKSRRVYAPSCIVSVCMDIAPDGSVMLCDTVDIKVTDVKKGIREAWTEYSSSELVKSLMRPENLKGSCRTCEHADTCLGGCHARALAIYGDLMMPDPLCPLVPNE